MYRLVFEQGAAISRDFVNAPERKAQIEKILTEEGGAEAKFEAVLSGAEQTRAKSQQERDESLLIETLGRDRVQIDND